MSDRPTTDSSQRTIRLGTRGTARWRGDAGDSPRVRYEIPREEGIRAARARLEQEVEDRRPALERGLETLAAEGRERQRPVFAECSGALPP